MENTKRIEAIGHLLAWYGNDLAFFREFQLYRKGKFSNVKYCEKTTNSFQDFLNAYRVARNFKKGQTEKLLEICVVWHERRQWEQVNELAMAIKDAGISHGMPISLASKVMFLMRPDLILPYDRQAKETLDLGGNDKDYNEFIQRAKKFENNNHTALDAGLTKVSDMLGILEANFSDLDLPFEKVRRLRLLDKMLWVGKEQN